MCKISEYPDVYQKTTEILRLSGVTQARGVGYELLRKAIVMYYAKYINAKTLHRSNPNWKNVGDNNSKWSSKRINRFYREFNNSFLKELKSGILIPSTREVSEKLIKINRDPALQWMIETLKSANIIKDQTEEERKNCKADPELAVKHFIVSAAKKL